jgi:putative transposase
MRIYPTDLTDSQWAKVEKIFDSRKRKHPLVEILNALFYITKSGIQWRMLPKEYPQWQLVYSVNIFTHCRSTLAANETAAWRSDG